MSLRPELYSYPRGNLATTTEFERNPGCSRLKKYRRKINWENEVHQVASKCEWAFEKSELEIIVRFLNSEEPEVQHRMNMVVGHFHRFKHRSKIWNCMNSYREEMDYQTACHEAGHVVSQWFTDSPKKVYCASIVPENGFVGRVLYDNLDRDYLYTNNDWFSNMCYYMGGQIAQQMLACTSRANLNEMRTDLVVSASFSYQLAKKTMEEAGKKGPEELMSFFFRECHKVSHKILKEHQRDLKGVSYALFAEKKLDYWDILEILGPRPQMDKTLYEEFIKDKISSGQIEEKKFANFFCDKQSCKRRRELLEEPISLKENVIDFTTLFKEEFLEVENL